MNRAFAAFLEDSCRAVAREVPEFPTQMGLFDVAGEPVPQDRFSGIDADSVARRRRLLQRIGEQLAGFPRQELDAAERISAGVLEFFVDYVYERGLIGRAGADFVEHDYPIRPSLGVQTELPTFLAELHPLRYAGDAEACVSRLRCIAPLLREAGSQLARRISAGLGPPALVVRDTLAEVDAFLAVPPEENIVLRRLADTTLDLPGLDRRRRALLVDDATAELTNTTYPAYRDLRDVLRDLEPRSAEAPGLWRLPGGDEWYAFLLRAATTTPMSADEVHELGLHEIGRLEHDIVRACREIGIAGAGIGECHRALDAAAGGAPEDTEHARRAIVERVKSLIAEIEPRLRPLFHRLPSGRVAVESVPRFAEAAKSHSYQPPSADGSRPARFELNVGQLLGEADAELAILVCHEIFPGHHLQLGLAGETQELPLLRRIVTFDAYIEGWAKYAELIPVLHGINDDPYFAVARMRRELLSTVNLALDTGIHARRWDEARATGFLARHSGASERLCRYLVHRSAAVPAQLCSYKIGMMKMLELRARAEQTLGPAFDVRDFHEALLRHGSLPLALLEAVVQEDLAPGAT